MPVTLNGTTIDNMRRRGSELDALNYNGTNVWPEMPAILPYLTFSCPGSFTLSAADGAKHWDGTLEYSTDTATWTVWDGTTTVYAAQDGADYFLYMRGSGNTKISGSILLTDTWWVLTGSGISCDGDIRTLLEYADPANTTMANYCFAYLFYGCTGLVSAPALPSETLSQYCYESMFSGCTALAQAPELPAKTLAAFCYNTMFKDCTSLAAAPALPAETLDMSCYTYMFRNCTAITACPELPAVVMKRTCYQGMFYGCTGITAAPKLPATTLAVDCYSNMFQGCTSLISLPALPALQLDSTCYRSMFYGCTGIKLSETQTGAYQNQYRIPEAGTGTTYSGAMTYMFTGTGGTFTGAPTINTTYYTSNEIIPSA